MRSRRRSVLLGDLMPLEEPLTDTTLRLTDGGAFAMFGLDGLSAETADVEELNVRHARVEHTLRNIGINDRLVLSQYVCRGMASPAAVPPASPLLAQWARDTHDEYRARLLDRSLYANRLFLGVHLRPAVAGNEWLDRRRARKGKSADGERAIDRARRLEDLCGWLASEFADYGPRLLGLAPRGRQVFSEAAEALAFALTGVEREVALTTGRLGDVVLAEEVTFHRETVEMRGPGHTVFAAMLALREYPTVTSPGMLDALLSAAFRFTLCQHYEPLSRSGGMGLLTRKQNKMVWAGSKALSQVAELDRAVDALETNRLSMGRHCLSLAVFSDRAGTALSFHERFLAALRRAGLGDLAADRVRDTLEEVAGNPNRVPLAEAVNDAWKLLGRSGASVARENKALMAAWLAQVPGNQRYRSRPGACSSRNFASLAPMHAYPAGSAVSRWGGPIATLRTTGGTAHPFHWHDGDGDDAVGNTLITGETGSGKTAGTGFLIAHTAGRADCILLDHKQGWHALALHLGGSYGVLGSGRPTFAPLKALENTPRNLDLLNQLLRGCIRQGGWRDLTTEEDRLLSLGIASVMENAPADRSVAEVAEFLSPDVDVDGAGARLLKWCWGGELGWALDAPTCCLDLSGGIVGLDTTELLTNCRAAAPALLYLFHRIALRLDGHRKLLLVVDEGWSVLRDPAFRDPIAAQFRTIRSKNGIVVFITQSPSDAVASGIASELIEQCPNQIHFPNPRASRDDYVDGLKRTVGEYEALKELQKGSGRFLLCKGARSLVAELPLRGMADRLAVLSASETSLRALETIPEVARRDPARLGPAFIEARRAARHRQIAEVQT